MSSNLFYKGTDIEVRLGDIVEYRSFWGFGKKHKGTVCYMPGESPIHRQFEDGGTPEWGIYIGNGNIIKIAYVPEEFQPPRGIKYISRGNHKEGLVKPDDEIL